MIVTSTQTSAVTAEVGNAIASPGQSGAVVFIDTRVPDLGRLIDGAHAGLRVVVLDAGADGPRQIADTLAAHGLRDLPAIHIVSHGTPGQIHIGATLLNARALGPHAAPLADIGASLAPGGGILLYGCDVASGAAGRHFIEELSVYTGAGVAAASHPVGAAEQGASWELDVSTGPIAAAGVAFSKETMAEYRGVLVNEPAGTDNTISTNEDTPRILTAADFGFTDPDDDPEDGFAAVIITTVPVAGSLTLNDVAVIAGQSVSIADINSNLLVFTPAANANGAGYASFTFQVQDDGGGTDLDQSANTMTIDVTAVNDAPAGTDNTISTNEDTPRILTAADFGFTDPDDDPEDGFAAVIITTVPVAGSLTLNDVAVIAGQSVSIADINSNLLVFTPAANANGAGYASFTFQVQDDGGGTDLDQSANTMTIDVTAVNDAPAGTDNTISTNEDTPRILTAADFGFTDPDDNPEDGFAAVIITTVPVAGSLTLNDVAVIAGQSVSIADINSNLLVFTPAANANGAGYASFTFQVQDDGGGTDLDQSANTMTIDVTAVNDAPAGTDNTISTNEDTPRILTAADFGFTDPDDDPEDGFAAVIITTVPVAGSLTLNDVAVIAGQSVSIADINSNLLVFTPAANANGAGYASFTFQVQDDGGGTDLDQSANTMTIDVTAVNDAPAGTDNTISTNEDTPRILTAADFGFTDPDDNPEDGFAAVIITTVPVAGSLTLNDVAVIAGQSVSIADINSNLLVFTPAANANGAGYASFTFQVQDDGGGTDLDQSANTMTIDVTSVNDAPAGTDNTISTNEDTPRILTAADFGFTDPNDNPEDGFAAVIITTVPVAGSLTLNDVAVIAGQSVSIADINSNLLVFTPAANANGAGYASFTFQVQDDGGGTDLDQSANTMTIDVTAVNDAPVLNAARTPVLNAVNEDIGAPAGAVGTLISALVDMPGSGSSLDNVTDVDAGALTGIALTGATGTGTWWYSINDGATWLAVGAVSDSSARLLAADAGTRLYYQPSPNANGTETITFRAWDRSGVEANGASGINVSTNGGTTPFSSAFDTANITINAVNDTPVNTVPGAQAATQNANHVISGISVSDVDVNGTSQHVRVTLHVDNGTLDIRTNGEGGLSNGLNSWQVSGDTTGTLVLTGTTEQINASLSGPNGLLIYRGNLNVTGSDVLTVTTNDLGHTGIDPLLTGDGTFEEAVSTISINISAGPASNTLSAFQSVALAPGGDVDGDGVVDPGDTVTVTVQIANNSATTAATGVQFTEALNGMTDTGAINVSPIAFNDAYNAVGNATLVVNGALGLLANDVEPLGDNGPGIDSTTVVVAASFNTANGAVVINNDGSFTWTPLNVDFTGSDTFSYTVRDVGIDGTPGNADDLIDTGTVTITITGTVWFIDNSPDAVANSTNVGTQANPFTSIAAFNAANGDGVGFPAAGDTIYLRKGTGTYSEADGFNLLDNQVLLGQGEDLVVNGITIANEVGSPADRPTISITGAGQHGIDLGSGNTIKGLNIATTLGSQVGIDDDTGTVGNLNISNVQISGVGKAIDIDEGGNLNVTIDSLGSTGSATQGVDLAGVSGTFTVSAGNIGGAAGAAFNVTGGNATITYSGTVVHSSAAYMISVSDTTGGAVTFNTAAANGLAGSGSSTGILIDGAAGNITINNANLTGFNGITILGDAANNATGTFTFNNVAIDTANGAANHAFIVNGDVSGPAGNDVIATINLNNVDIVNPGGNVADIKGLGGGSINFDSASSISRTDGGLGIVVTSNSGGTITFGGSAKTLNTGTNNAVDLTDNTSTTINFTNGGLDIDTTSGIGFRATGGGTISVTGSGNSIDSTAGMALDIENTQLGSSGVTFNTVSSTNSATSGIKLIGVTGGGATGVSIGGGTIIGADQAAFQVGNGGAGGAAGTGGTSVISFGGTITNTTASGGLSRAVDIQDRGGTAGNITLSGNINHNVNGQTGIYLDDNAGGTITFSGASKSISSGTAAAVSLTDNAGATISFTGGGLVINSTSGTGFNATGAGAAATTGGTVTVEGTGNTITSTTGTALNVVHTTIGANNLTFQSISSNGASSGIVLNNTGTSGGLIVTGDNGTTANGSGGTINASTGAGISLTNTRGVSLDQMNIQNGGNDGISGSNVTNFTLIRSNITNNGNADEEHGIEFAGLFGTVVIDNTLVRGSFEHNVKIVNTNGTLDSLNIKNSTFDHLSVPASPAGGNGLLIQTQGTAVLTNASVSGNTFRNNFSDGISLAAEGNSRIGLDNATGSATVGFVIANNFFHDNNTAINAGQFNNADLTVDIQGNTIINNSRTANSGAVPGTSTSMAIVVGSSAIAGAGSSLNARIENNIIGDANIAGSGSSLGSGIRVIVQGLTDGTILINNNTIRQTPVGFGIEATFLGPQDDLGVVPVSDITITNNNVNHVNVGFKPGTSNFPLPAIYLAGDNQGSTSSAAGQPTVRADVRGNTVPAGTSFNFTGAFLELFEYGPPASGNLQLVDTGAVSPNATAQLTSTNTGSAAANSDVSLLPGSTILDLPPDLTPLPLLAAPGGVAAAEWQLAGIGDFNGDGSGDLLWLRSDGALRIDTINGGEVTNWYIIGRLETGWQIVGTGDLNNDGTTDILLQHDDGTYQAELIWNSAVVAAVDLELVDGQLRVVVPAAPESETPPSETPPAAPISDPPAEAAPGTVEMNLTQAQLDSVVSAAIARWEATGLTDAQSAYLRNVTFSVSDMAGLRLGSAKPGHITIDSDAAGYGWYLDANPADDAEFGNVLGATRLQTDAFGLPAGHVDLLSTVMHELGHQLGIEDSYALADRDSLMYGYLVTGERRLPGAGEAYGATPGSIASEEFALGILELGTLPAGKTVTIQFNATVDPSTPTPQVQYNQFIVNPSNSGTVNSSFPTVNTNTSVTTIDSLTLGNLVFNDLNFSGVFDAGDAGIDGVTLRLYADSNNTGGLDGADTLLATTTTAGGGFYTFIGLAPGNYIVAVESANFESGGALYSAASSLPLISLSGSPDPDNDVDNDDNGGSVGGVAGVSIASAPITLAYNSEPVNDDDTDADTNTTLDFGFQDVPPDLAPIVTPGANTSYIEQQTTPTDRVIVGAGLTADDPDGTTLESATVRISAATFVLGDQLSFTPLAGISGGYDPTTGTLTFTGEAPEADYQTVLRSVTFHSTSDNPTAFGTRPARSIEWTVNDGLQDSAPVTTTVAITAVNDAPAIAVVAAGTIFVVGSGTPVALTTGTTVSDVDDTQVDSATVTITDFFSGDELSVAGATSGGPNPAGISWSYDGAGVLTFTGQALLADYKALLDQVQYSSTDPSPTDGIPAPEADKERTIEWRVFDGELDSPATTTTVKLDALPVLDLDTADATTAPGSKDYETTFTEDTSGFGATPVSIAGNGLTFTPSDTSIEDDDDDFMQGATIDLTNAKPGDKLVFQGDPDGIFDNVGITLNTLLSTDTHIVLEGTASLAAYAAVLQLVAFTSDSENPDQTPRTVEVFVFDGIGNSNTAIATVNVVSVNDAPENTVPGPLSVNEDTNLSITGISIADPDADPATDDITVTLHVDNGTLDIRTDVAGGITAGQVTDNGTATVVVTATLNQINATLAAPNGLIYRGDLNFNGVDELTITTNDNGNDEDGTPAAFGEEDIDTVEITVNPLDDAPTLTATAQDPVFTEDGAAAVLFSAVSASTIEAGQTFASMTLTVTNVTDGADEILNFDGTSLALTHGNFVPTTAINALSVSVSLVGTTATVTFSGAALTAAQLVALVGGLTYRNASQDPTDADRVVTITQLIDSGSNTSPHENTATLALASTVNVNPVNDEPTLTATGLNPVFTEDGPAADIFSAVTASTIEAAQSITSLTLTVTNVTDGADEILSIDGSDVALTHGNVVVTANGTVNVVLAGTTATVTFSSAGVSASVVQTLVDALSYSNTSNTPTDADRVVTLTQLVDSGSDNNTTVLNIVSTVDVNPTNDLPVFANVGALIPPVFIEGGASILLDTDISVSDVELAVADNYDGTTLFLERNGGPNPDDVFGASGLLDLADGNNVIYNGVVVGIYSNPGDGSFSITFNSFADAATVASVMQSIIYSNTSDNPPPQVNIAYLFSDGNGVPGGQPQGGGPTPGIATGIVTVEITPVNDRPAVVGAVTVASYTIGSPGVVISPPVGVVDPDSNIVNATVRITDGYRPGDILFVRVLAPADPNLGVKLGVGNKFTIDNVQTDIQVVSDALGTLVLSGTGTTAQYQRILAEVSYRSTAADPTDGGFTRNRTITWQVNDGTVATPLVDAQAPYAAGGFPQSVAAADLDGDGLLDLVTANLGGTVSVLINNANPPFEAPGTFGPPANPTNFAAGTAPIFVVTGDLDGNGTIDVVVANNTGGVSVLLGNGAGGLGAATSFAAGTNPIALATGDFNKDGVIDLVVANNGSANVSILLGNGAGGFGTAANFNAGVNPTAVAIGDFDRDGNDDLVVSNAGSDNVTILLGTGTGSFGAANPFSTGPGTGPRSVATADFNGDGFLDIVTANQTTGNVSVLYGDGTGAFGGLATFAAGAGAYNVTIGDINADGYYDIVVANAGGSSISVLLGSSVTPGTFLAAENFTTGASPFSVALADLNNDGGLDFAAANSGAATVSVLLNAGSNMSNVARTLLGFNQPPIVDLDGSEAGFDFTTTFTENGAAIAIADTDLTVTDADNANVQTLTIDLTNAKAGDSLSLAGPLPGGIDAIIDTSVPGHIRILMFNLASPADYAAALALVRFSNSSEDPDTTTRDITVVADDGEGAGPVAHAFIQVVAVNDAPVLADVAASAKYKSHGAPIVIDPTLTISDVDNTTLASATVRVAAGTFAGDGGVLAVSAGGLAGTSITASYNAATQTLTLTGTDTLAHYEQVLEHVTFESTALNPTNSGANRTRTIEWQLNDGSGFDNLSAIQTTTINIVNPLQDDFNGDAHSDVLFQNDDGTAAVWLMNGTGVATFGAGLPNPNAGLQAATGGGPTGLAGLPWKVIDSGDFNGDGKADILWQHHGGAPAVWLMDGTNAIAYGPALANSDPTWRAKEAADFNGDGKADILWQNDGGAAAVWLMDGTGVAAYGSALPNPGPTWHVKDAADFNGDGKADILWQNDSGAAAIWLMDGTEVLAFGAALPNPGPTWHAVAAGDFNGDGKADILWQNDSGAAAVWLMNGTEALEFGAALPNPGPTWHVKEAGDYNGDGKADILWQNDSGVPAVWLMDGTDVVTFGPALPDPGPSWHII